MLKDFIAEPTMITKGLLMPDIECLCPISHQQKIAIGTSRTVHREKYL